MKLSPPVCLRFVFLSCLSSTQRVVYQKTHQLSGLKKTKNKNTAGILIWKKNDQVSFVCEYTTNVCFMDLCAFFPRALVCFGACAWPITPG